MVPRLFHNLLHKKNFYKFPETSGRFKGSVITSPSTQTLRLLNRRLFSWLFTICSTIFCKYHKIKLAILFPTCLLQTLSHCSRLRRALWCIATPNVICLARRKETKKKRNKQEKKQTGKDTNKKRTKEETKLRTNERKRSNAEDFINISSSSHRLNVALEIFSVNSALVGNDKLLVADDRQHRLIIILKRIH